jgi:amino acid transporter
MNIAGPSGLLVAWAFVSVTAICVLDGLAEMTIMWPVSNAMVEYVKAFVDRDLAIVVGLAYWFVRLSYTLLYPLGCSP